MTNPDAKVEGTTLTYTLRPVTNELPGTYTLGVRAVLKDEVETCTVCHGKDSELNAKTVHSTSQPYVPPYARAPREP